MNNINKRVAVMISGYGGNLQALIDNTAFNGFPAEIVLVISNKADAYGLQRAKKHNIPSYVINHKDYPNRAEFDEAIHRKLLEYDIEIVCLAGFMLLLTADFVNKWQGRMLNIHPSLLPAFKGNNAVEDAFKAGVKETGCTVHYVIPEMDAGPIIVQRKVIVLPNDTIDSLYNKIFYEETQAYPEALYRVCVKLLREEGIKFESILEN